MSESSEPDDLTRLDGVGPKTAAALTAGGITTMEQLARSRIDDLVALLDRAGVSKSAERIMAERWLQQAWRAAGRPSSGATATPTSGVVMATPEVAATVDPVDASAADAPRGTAEEPIVRNGPPSAPTGWREHASFIVSFDHRAEADDERWQTRVWDAEAMVELTVPGAAPGTWIDFILERAALPRLF